MGIDFSVKSVTRLAPQSLGGKVKKDIKEMKIKMIAYIDNTDINVTTIGDFMKGVKLFAMASGFAEESFEKWFKEG